jgi:indolepyruvate ferredoxin oxidoreductase beta subunit
MTTKSEINIIICGVGGQGVVLLSELLGNSAVRDGVAVKGSEVLGMAQRGGSVFSNLRLGSSAIAPMTPEGSSLPVSARRGLICVTFAWFGVP